LAESQWGNNDEEANRKILHEEEWFYEDLIVKVHTLNSK
jgi:hypothetical protein